MTLVLVSNYLETGQRTLCSPGDSRGGEREDGSQSNNCEPPSSCPATDVRQCLSQTRPGVLTIDLHFKRSMFYYLITELSRREEGRGGGGCVFVHDILESTVLF